MAMDQPKVSQQPEQTISYLGKWSGKTVKAQLPDPSMSNVFWSFIAGFLGILAISFLAKETQIFQLFAPFGASAVLLYGAPTAPFSQPRNLVGGHLISALIGVVVVNFLGNTYITVALAVSLAIAVMLLTKTVHPPAGATALLGVISSQGNYTWILAPVGVGALILLLVALIVNNLSSERIYPNYWF